MASILFVNDIVYQIALLTKGIFKSIVSFHSHCNNMSTVILSERIWLTLSLVQRVDGFIKKVLQMVFSG